MIDLASILNFLRMILPSRRIGDFVPLEAAESPHQQHEDISA